MTMTEDDQDQQATTATESSAVQLHEPEPEPVGRSITGGRQSEKSKRRPPPLEGLGDGRAASYGLAVAALRSPGTEYDRASVVEWVHKQAHGLASGDVDVMVQVLAGQSLVLEAVMLQFSQRLAAVPASKHQAAAVLAKVLLNTQAAYVRTVGAISALHGRKGSPLDPE
jgi:hypothetical protein